MKKQIGYNYICIKEEKIMNIDKGVIQELLDASSAKVEAVLKDTAALENILQSAEQKLSEIPGVGQYAANLPTMLSMIRSYMTKEYTEVSYKVIATMVGALVYILKGNDMIPDKIPVVGALDDLAVLGLALQINAPELDAYRAWRDGHNNVAAAEEKTEAETEVKEEA